MLALKTKTTVTILLLAAMVLMVNTGTPDAANGHSVGIVTAKEVRVQSEPGKHGLLQKTLTRGTRLTIIRRRQGWIQILHDGEVGFIQDQARLIRILPTEKPTPAREASGKPSGRQRQLDEYENGKNISARK